jgi:flagellar protein FlbD
MIRLTRLNSKPFVINADLINFVEETPDTLIVMANGDRLHVRESVDEVVDRTLAYRRQIYAVPVVE